MSKPHAFFLTVLIWAFVVAAVPLGVALWEILLPKIVAMGLWWYSAMMGAVASPFFYLMLRRMK